MVKNPSANAGGTRTQVGTLGQEDPLEEEMVATYSRMPAWKFHGQGA